MVPERGTSFPGCTPLQDAQTRRRACTDKCGALCRLDGVPRNLVGSSSALRNQDSVDAYYLPSTRQSVMAVLRVDHTAILGTHLHPIPRNKIGTLAPKKELPTLARVQGGLIDHISTRYQCGKPSPKPRGLSPPASSAP